jgi:signal transduction histidine kinase/PAS domain-containing protein
MTFDLATLMAVRVCVDALIAIAFWAQSRRHPSVGGSMWWSWAAVSAIVAMVTTMGRGVWPDVVTIPVSNTAFTASFLCVWIGFRQHQGLSMPLRQSALAMLVLLLAYAVFVGVWNSMPARQLLYVAATLTIQVLQWRDIRRVRAARDVPELRAVAWVTALEALAIATYGVAVVTIQVTFATAAPWLMFYFLVMALVRAAAFNALALHRLWQDGERARLRLLLSEADSRALIQNLSAGVLVFSPDRTLARINDAARRFLGWQAPTEGANAPAKAEAVWFMLNEAGEPMRRHDLPFERVLATGQPVQDVIVGIPMVEQGAVRWALCNAHPENDASGGLRHVVLTFIDITTLRQAQAEQKGLQAQLAQSQKMEALGTLAGGVAHDFNNILAAILGNASLARQDLAPDAPAQVSLREIGVAARRGRELVRQILAFSRQQPAARTELDMADIVREACALLRAALPPSVRLVQRIGANVPTVLADATQLGQVLVNLGTNALHAMQGRTGQVEFCLDALPSDSPFLPPEMRDAQSGVRVVRLRVIDNGCGMDEAVRQRLFEPFFTTKPVGQGTGLGLPVVLGIMQTHGGAIQVQSEEGVGTTMTLYLRACHDSPLAASAPEAQGSTISAWQALSDPPATTAPASPAPQPIPTPAPIEPDMPAPHILYLDDDETLVFLVSRLLERRGYRVAAFVLQDQALAAVRDNPQAYSLLLTDFNMPGMSGLDVAREALAISPQLNVAVASGYITEELQAEAQAIGVREVIFKTDAVEDFCDVVGRLIAPAA